MITISPLSRRLFFVLLFLLVVCDFAFLALHPSYRYYRRHSDLVEERLASYERVFKADYIAAINRVADALTNRPSASPSPVFTPVLPLPSASSPDSPVSRPFDISRRDYRYFEVSGVRGFSLSGGLVFRVGDFFLGRVIVSADRFGAVLSDGGVVRLDLEGSRSSDPPPSTTSKELVKNVK